MQEVTYKGHLITFHCSDKWIATVWGPSADMAAGGQVVTATREEGADILLSRVRARIDRQKANGKASTPPAPALTIRARRQASHRAHRKVDSWRGANFSGIS